MERDLAIFRGQCLNIAVEAMKQKGHDIMNLKELFDKAKEIYEYGKTNGFIELK